MYELIYSTLSAWMDLKLPLFFLKAIIFISAMKLFLAPKNITGNEKNTETRNPAFIAMKIGSYSSSFSSAKR